ncbi:MAG: spore cortex biosynthesis protein YabQ [Ruminococcus sp.]|nr:spore cortex biosynthesis protein YabQ [Candidatus Copronaster equi]
MDYVPQQLFQAKGFACAAALGFVLSAFYDIYRIALQIFTRYSKKTVFVSDIIYMCFCMLVNFIFLLVMCEGQLVFYAFSGQLAGWLIHRFAVGNLLYNEIIASLSEIRKKIKKIFEKNKKNT